MINRALKRVLAIVCGVLVALAAAIVPAWAGENYGLVIDNRGAGLHVAHGLPWSSCAPNDGWLGNHLLRLT